MRAVEAEGSACCEVRLWVQMTLGACFVMIITLTKSRLALEGTRLVVMLEVRWGFARGNQATVHTLHEGHAFSAKATGVHLD